MGVGIQEKDTPRIADEGTGQGISSDGWRNSSKAGVERESSNDPKELIIKKKSGIDHRQPRPNPRDWSRKAGAPCHLLRNCRAKRCRLSRGGGK